MADRDNLSEVQQFARDLNRDREDLGQNRDELTESLTELHREPRATLEVTYDELAALYDGEINLSFGHKVDQLWKLETGPGGRFVDPA